jgi:hypothetical protein
MVRSEDGRLAPKDGWRIEGPNEPDAMIITYWDQGRVERRPFDPVDGLGAGRLRARWLPCCLVALRERGRVALLLHVIAEWFDLLNAAVRTHRGALQPITGGFTPRQSPEPVSRERPASHAIAS